MYHYFLVSRDSKKGHAFSSANRWQMQIIWPETSALLFIKTEFKSENIGKEKNPILKLEGMSTGLLMRYTIP